jgi:hypothetical protein
VKIKKTARRRVKLGRKTGRVFFVPASMPEVRAQHGLFYKQKFGRYR